LILLCGGAAVLASTHWGQLSWRIKLHSEKLRGDLPELRWSELFAMTLGPDKFNLSESIDLGRSLDASVTNPYVTEEDHKIGARVFIGHCAACHGTDATGGHGPSLIRVTYDHGDSDFAVYRVVRDGVASTAMVPTGLTAVQRWQVIGYIRTLQHRAVQSAAVGTHVQPINISAADLEAAGTRADQWITYAGSLKGWRYSIAGQITPANVQQLRPVWIRQFPTESTANESTPLIVGDTLMVTESPSNAVAIDVRTGQVRWRYDRELPAKLPVCCGWVNRGLAVYGKNVFLATLDAHLLALDVATGHVQWDVEVEKPAAGYTMTLAPLAFGNMVVVGVSGGEFGIRGFIAAYDATTGKPLWKFHTIPEPGEAGHESWRNDAWRTGGGPTWITGSYDPTLDLLYWGVGNPGPDYQGDVRPGDNLYTDSVVALHAHTGKLAWHFQFTPHDEHDWDSNQTPMLVDTTIDGVARRTIAWANRNGFYYVLDRTTGEFITAKPFVQVNWAEGIDAKGRPILAQAGKVSQGGKLTHPGVGGGTNWQPAAYNPQLGLIFVHANDQGSVFTKASVERVARGDQGFFVASGAENSEAPLVTVRALDVVSGQRRWEYASPVTQAVGGFTGLLTTAGGLVFGASGGHAFAVDAATGREVWNLFLGGTTRAPPVSFELDGRQMVAIWAGRALFLFGL
jgi:alcohol dehydrogenase (cytochrome c)